MWHWDYILKYKETLTREQSGERTGNGMGCGKAMMNEKASRMQSPLFRTIDEGKCVWRTGGLGRWAGVLPWRNLLATYGMHLFIILSRTRAMEDSTVMGCYEQLIQWLCRIKDRRKQRVLEDGKLLYIRCFIWVSGEGIASYNGN